MRRRAWRQRRLLAPEVVQTSAMDCGPASLKCLLEGFYIPASYGRLREACQTDVDGSSIDTLEAVAAQLGLQAEQVMLPVDHVLLPVAGALPALAIVQLPHGDTHFVVLWRRHGDWVQVMDPATGRRWSRASQVMDDLYVHSLPVPADAWLAWASSESFIAPLRHRMARLKVASSTAARLIDEALSSDEWRPLATLDAAVRMVDALVRCGGLRRGRQAEGALRALLERDLSATHAGDGVPEPYWSVRPAPDSDEGEAQVLLRGAVLIQVEGRRAAEPLSETEAPASPEAALTPELAAALEETPSRPARDLWRLLRQDGLLSPTLLTLALGLGAGGVLVEALLFRGLIDLSRDLTLSGQRLGAMALMVALLLLLLALDLAAASGVLRGGRRLEVRLRTAFLAKLPRLADRYLHSRPLSDMAERSHSVHRIRQLLSLGGHGLQLTFELIMTTAAMVWLAPSTAPFAIPAALLAIGIPLAAQPALGERDLRVRTHDGALSRFDLDALRGLAAVRAHGADRAMAYAHHQLLGEWARANLGVHRLVVTVEGLQLLTGFGLAAALLTQQALRGDGHAMILLLVYWALNLPMIGQDLALLARQYPAQRSVTLRLLEPLGALEDEEAPAADVEGQETPTEAPGAAAGVAIALEHVQVRQGGHVVLEKIDLQIPAGQHVAIVGASGAGKSSLVGALLGWHRPTTGCVRIDGRALDGPGLEQLRRQTAWVDPAVHLWNRSLFDNLHYGAAAVAARSLPEVIEAADLRQVLDKLPDGLQSHLGESGARLSGGEGQRVRFGRALLRPQARLVILDEAFRGLDRGRRRELLDRARRMWAGATLLCVTHDVGDTQGFERVLVIDQGHVVEDGAPGDLLARPESKYRELIEAEAAVRAGMWSGPQWRQLALRDGQLHETGGGRGARGKGDAACSR